MLGNRSTPTFDEAALSVAREDVARLAELLQTVQAGDSFGPNHAVLVECREIVIRLNDGLGLSKWATVFPGYPFEK